MAVSCVAALVQTFAAVGACIGHHEVFAFRGYCEVRREQAVRLAELVMQQKLLVELFAVLALRGRDRPKPTELQAAIQTYLRYHPRANCSSKYSDAAFARYATHQLLVMFAHIRRLQINGTKNKRPTVGPMRTPAKLPTSSSTPPPRTPAPKTLHRNKNAASLEKKTPAQTCLCCTCRCLSASSWFTTMARNTLAR